MKQEKEIKMKNCDWQMEDEELTYEGGGFWIEIGQTIFEDSIYPIFNTNICGNSFLGIIDIKAVYKSKSRFTVCT